MSSHLFEVVETAIIENRAQRRHPVSLTATLGDQEVLLRNLSRGGAQLACPVSDYAALHPRFEDGFLPLVLRLHVPVPVEVDVVYANRAGDQYLIGVQFREMGAPERGHLEAYVRALEG